MKISTDVYSVGVLNPTMRIFDIIMYTGYGTSYNAYLLTGEKTVLIDTVHETFAEHFFENIEAVCPVEEIDYLIMNHTEPDHSGSVKYLLEKNPNIVVYGTMSTIKNLQAITGKTFTSVTVKDGDTLDIGGKTLTFLVAPMLHWPDTMMSWSADDRILFSCDFLGAHYCEPAMYLDKSRKPALYDSEFANYYRAIMAPFQSFVVAGLAKIADLPIDTLCPSHGPFLRGADVAKAISAYTEWSKPSTAAKHVSIFYVSAYGYTKEMADHLQKRIGEAGIQCNCYNVIETPAEVIAEQLESSAALLFGSPTINRAALKPIWDVISSLDAVSCAKKPVATFGCYGWSGEACGQLDNRLKDLKCHVLSPGVRANFAPTPEVFDQLNELSTLVIQTLA